MNWGGGRALCADTVAIDETRMVAGRKEKGEKMVVRGEDGSTTTQFLHSPESWREM